ncbi:hypothetical protein B0H34DRAFT_825189 [Crassisporium funariophilum]|nr:hypothetical protein B0H34DRAFT_825189 [Crassisporium funariophilum]
MGKQTLNQYYNKTDHSEVYRIAMVLHPCQKHQYFKTAGWEDVWIETAHNIVWEEFDQTYMFMDFDNEVVSVKKKPSLSSNIFDKLPSLSAPVSSELCDELDQYLTTNPEQVTNVC